MGVWGSWVLIGRAESLGLSVYGLGFRALGKEIKSKKTTLEGGLG